MRIVRFREKDQVEPKWGWLADDRIGSLDGTPFDEFRREEALLPFDHAEILPPVQPGKIICVGRNYAAHAAEHDADLPELPLIFLKPPTSIIGLNETILLPPQSKRDLF